MRGAQLHDLGLLGLEQDQILLPDCKLTRAEWAVQLDSVCDQVVEMGVQLSPRMEKIVLERRARWDGQGFPKSTPGYMNEFAQIVAFASCYENLLSGRETGFPLDPKLALGWLTENQNDGRFRPEWVQRRRSMGS